MFIKTAERKDLIYEDLGVLIFTREKLDLHENVVMCEYGNLLLLLSGRGNARLDGGAGTSCVKTIVMLHMWMMLHINHVGDAPPH